MTKLGKLLTVFIFFTSVAFLGFTLVNSVAGPNFQAKADEMKEFVFQRSGPDSPYNISYRGLRTDNVGTATTLPEAVVRAQRAKLNDQEQELQRLNESIPALQNRTKQAAELIAMDIEGMHRRQDELEAQLQDLTQQIAAVAKQADEQTKKAKETYDLVSHRREEYILIKNQLEELRVHRTAIEAERQLLRDLLVQTRENLRLAERRQILLQQDGATATYETETN